ncbi:MAG: chemotaxis protein CheW [Candidatus Woesearchaeota archaeon]
MKKIVEFILNQERFGLNINVIKEIIKVPDYTALPKSDPYVEGVINLRGTVISVIDLAKKLGFPSKEIDNETRIIVIERGDDYVGLRVDGVDEVLSINEEDMQKAPGTTSVDKDLIEGIITREEDMLIIIDIDKIISVEEANQLPKN